MYLERGFDHTHEPVRDWLSAMHFKTLNPVRCQKLCCRNIAKLWHEHHVFDQEVKICQTCIL